MAQDQTQEVALRADHKLEYPYIRATGPILGRFFTEIRDNGKFVGVKTSTGRVICPPVDVDPDSLEDLSVEDMVEVGTSGVVTTWSWLSEARPKNPLDKPFAWALIQLDGADTALLHAVDAGSEEAMSTGMRVKATFIDERKGDIHDIACFVPED
ncbi:MAG: OB-fold domain-containing protein [Deltaproteobacteria bacterium]|nr:OB-fold domain-containing protein [Deltaproteobacteria bacterium]